MLGKPGILPTSKGFTGSVTSINAAQSSPVRPITANYRPSSENPVISDASTPNSICDNNCILKESDRSNVRKILEINLYIDSPFLLLRI